MPIRAGIRKILEILGTVAALEHRQQLAAPQLFEDDQDFALVGPSHRAHERGWPGRAALVYAWEYAAGLSSDPKFVFVVVMLESGGRRR